MTDQFLWRGRPSSRGFASNWCRSWMPGNQTATANSEKTHSKHAWNMAVKD